MYLQSFEWSLAFSNLPSGAEESVHFEKESFLLSTTLCLTSISKNNFQIQISPKVVH